MKPGDGWINANLFKEELSENPISKARRSNRTYVKINDEFGLNNTINENSKGRLKLQGKYYKKWRQQLPE